MTLTDLKNASDDFIAALGGVTAANSAKQTTAEQLAAAQADDAVSDHAVAAAETVLNDKKTALESVIDALAASPPPSPPS